MPAMGKNGIRSPLKLLIATNNSHKLRELQEIIGKEVWQLVAPIDVGLNNLKIEEDGHTYHQNAAKKARAYSNASGLPALADDSGLEVDALDGQPGLHSARYAGVDLTGAEEQDLANRRKLLAAMRDVLPTKRTARFRAVLALAFPYGPNVRYGEGIIEGKISTVEIGSNGCGYDPIFQLPDGRCLAEISGKEKNSISHRGKAVQDIQWALDTVAETLKKIGSDANGKTDSSI